ncbi:hypothetical protein BHM03_00049845 [Ensete ventricosum]|nr:hypothetical protein BHM03_00049845 [Ensete ventricosum]
MCGRPSKSGNRDIRSIFWGVSWRLRVGSWRSQVLPKARMAYPLLLIVRLKEHRRLRQLRNMRDDSLYHPSQRLDLIGEAEKGLG